MAFLKYILPYTLCAVALVLFQNSFVLSDDALQCVRCSSSSANATNLTKCDNTAITISDETLLNMTTCSSNSCGTYTWKNSDGTVFTERGCNITCSDSLKTSLNVSSGWNCTMCNNTDSSNFCNQVAITNGASHSFLAVVPMVLSAVLATYFAI
ncbi:uncharacterized protein LOC126747027 [Anthonomus grandis grandis]|uniref:uncharacterized protein LOC126747027 n=1 Tax=Anthonomus grandis grandis TaxID=2921223 RepID=UPI00216607DA|nr:uncharacterized protein LOC126747027 [Anthonomus grandis grandis]